MPTTSSRTIVSASAATTPPHWPKLMATAAAKITIVADERQRHVADPILLIELALAPVVSGSRGPRKRYTRAAEAARGEQHAEPRWRNVRREHQAGHHQWRGEEDDDRRHETRARRPRGRAAIVSGLNPTPRRT